MASDDAIGASLDASELRAYVEKHNLENFVSRAVYEIINMCLFQMSMDLNLVICI